MNLSNIKYRIWNGSKMVFGPTDDNPSPSWVLAAAPLFKHEPDQFIGFKDINGFDIYTGDILNSTLFDGKNHEIVTFEDGAFRIKAIYNEFHRSDLIFDKKLNDVFKLVVIGNIHANPELLT